MTRVNLVDPGELTDQHLMAEWREIKMVPKALARSVIARGVEEVLTIVPSEFTLNKGHVCFFYDKGEHLHRRYVKLTSELQKRGYDISKEASFDPDGVFEVLDERFSKNYRPTTVARNVSRERIAEKIAEKPTWYRWTLTSED